MPANEPVLVSGSATKPAKPHARLDMVPWASPSVLRRAAIRAVMAPLFGRFADKRELMGMNPMAALEPNTADVNWVDFVADTGEGFDSTYTVARLVSADRLPRAAGEDPDAPGVGLPRGKLLLAGGDLVYPYAERGAYRDRFEVPWSRALPPLAAPASAPKPGSEERLFIIPGNHDWYDGLTSFRRAFASFEHRPIGRRGTAQDRSYFAVSLGHDWWAFGIDLQFDGFVDDEQMRYFVDVAQALPAGRKVLLVVPEPLWVNEASGKPPAARIRPIEYFTSRVLGTRHTLRVVVTGDLHHFSVYDEEMPGDPGTTRPWITCGGGGAHLRGTHDLPKAVKIDRTETIGPLHLQKDSVYPTARRSWWMGWKAALLPVLCPPVAVVLGIAAVVLAALLGLSGTETLTEVPFLSPLAWWKGAKHLLLEYPLTALASLVGILLMTAAVDSRHVWVRIPVGFVHAAAHGLTFFVLYQAATRAAIEQPETTSWIIRGIGFAAIALALTRAATKFPRTLRWLPVLLVGALFVFLGFVAVERDDVADQLLRMLALLAVPAGLAHALVFGLYLALSSACGGHVGPAFAAQSNPHYKCFLRMRVAKDGLRIYPIAIDDVCRRWTWDEASERYEPNEAPSDFLDRARALAPPIHVK